MTRINTNVSSLIAQNNLARSNNDLQNSLTRLSTGLRINRGKDDPAGLIASEALRSDIISVEKAISNSERANQLIATADSALGQVSNLLNDIRGLVTEAANTGALSDDQIAANQLQLDSSLEAIDRIAQITSFQGKRLLDGNLDFITQGVNDSAISNLQVDQANFGTLRQINVDVNVVAQATRGSLNFAFGSIADSVTLQIAGRNGSEAFSFGAGSSIEDIASAVNLGSDATGVKAVVSEQSTKGSIAVSSLGLDNDILLEANEAGFDPGNFNVKFSKGGTATTSVNYTPQAGSAPGTIDVHLRTTEAIAATGEISDSSVATKAAVTIDGGNNDDALVFTATTAGAAGNNIKVEIANDGVEAVSFNQATNTLRVSHDGTTSANKVIELVNSDATASQFVTAALAETDKDLAGTNDGTSNVADTTATNLAGGKGDVNNDLAITANLTGTQFNNSNVHIVNGSATAAGISSLNRNAAFTLSEGGATIDFTAAQGGAAGNDVEIIFTSAAAPETVSVNGSTITVTLDSGGTTADELATLINNDVAASQLVSANVTANGGTNVAAYVNDGVKLNNGHHATASVTNTGTTVSVRAKASGPAGDFNLVFADATAGRQATFDESTNTITVELDNGGGDTATQIKAALEANAEIAGRFDISIEGDATQDFTGEASTTASTRSAGQAEFVEYSADAKKARTSITFAGAGGGVSNNDIILEANTAGAAYNNVSVVLQTSAAVDPGAPTATYDEDNKVITLTLSSSGAGATNISDIADALEAIEVDGEQAFTVINDDSASDGDGTGTVDGNALGTITAGDEIGNTANTGGDAGTLFLFVEEGVSTANDIFSQLANAKAAGTGLTASEDNLTARAAELFTIQAADDNDGTGKLFALTSSGALTGGQKGGEVAADANEVIAAINQTAGLSSLITASLSGSDDGKNVAVASFSQFAFTGSASSQNRLQFLSDAGAADLSFVQGAAGSSLSITDNRGFAKLTKDSDDANSALVFNAKNKGSEYDGVRVEFVDDDDVTKGNELVSFDADNKVLKFRIASGNTAGSNTTAADVIAALEGDDLASQFFAAGNFGTSDGTGEVDADLVQADAVLSYNANADQIRIRSNTYGTDGNDLQVEITDAGAGGATSISFDGSKLSIAIDVAGTTVAELAEQVNNAVGEDFTAEVVATAGGAVAATTATNLAGGLGTDLNGDSVPDATANPSVTSGGRGDKLIVNLAVDANGQVTTTANDLSAFFDDPANSLLVNDFGISVSNAEGSDGSGTLSATDEDVSFATEGVTFVSQQASGTSIAVNGDTARIQVTAVQQGSAFDNVTVELVNDDGLTAGNEVATYDGASKTLKVTIDQGNTSADQVIAAINNQLSTQFTAAQGGVNGTGKVTTSDTLTLTGGVSESGNVDGASFLGNADQAATGLRFESTEYGSAAFVAVKTLSGSFALTDSTGAESDRNSGADVDARINGIQAVGRGLKASINTSSLDLSFTLNESVADGGSYSFQIVGGGAQFQLGPEVVSNQQARVGIQSVSTSTLGGVSGRLFELRSGGTKSLSADVGGAAKVIDEVISVVTSLRGRLGAFQKTTLDSNINSLNDTLANLTEAESSIRDADFAAESAKLTRAQILVQSGTSVLGIANSNPQNALSLLR